MNTDSNTRPRSTTNTSREIVRALDESAILIPIGQMLQELQLIVERLTFAVGSGEQGRAVTLTSGDVTALLGSDVSPALVTFALWLQQRGLLGVLSGKSGRHFLSFCVQHYRSVREITCSVPIPLSDEFRNSLVAKLRTLYPEPARIIFKVAPSLMAGCVIDDGRKLTDMSLLGRMPELVGVYIAAQPQGAVSGS